jgi:hypothetical protein
METRPERVAPVENRAILAIANVRGSVVGDILEKLSVATRYKTAMSAGFGLKCVVVITTDRSAFAVVR